jgi:hypothetical protein
MSKPTKSSVEVEFKKALLANEASLIKMSSKMAEQLRALADDFDKTSRMISEQMKSVQETTSQPRFRR